MSLQLITFDLDDTLWDAAPVLHAAEAAQAAWLRAHRPRTAAHLAPEAIAALKRRVWQEHSHLGHNLSQLRQQMLFELQCEAGYAEAEARAGAAAAFAVFHEQRQRVSLFDQVLPVLRQLTRRYRLAALTNGNADVFRTPAAAFFEFALSAEQVGAGKPAPALFDAALARSGLSAQQAVHVGDSLAHDILGARNAGMRSVWFNPGRALPGSGDCTADAQIQCLSELPALLLQLDD
jgi:putative hydrolase of the HAD superfamily